MAVGGWLVPTVAFLGAGMAATYYLRRIRLPREEMEAGIAALAGMRWRDFIHLVLAALNRRGYERVFDTAGNGDEGDYLLERHGQRWLLSSKHGAAYVVGSTAIAEFANTVRMRSAAGGLLVTPGRFAPEARTLAGAQRIELLDGPTLWPEVRPLIPREQVDEIAAPAEGRANRHVLMAWGGALALGVVLLALLPDASGDGDTAAEATAARSAAPHDAPVTNPMAPLAEIPTDPAVLEQRRVAAMRAVTGVPGVDRALWSTQSTLLVYLSDELAEPLTGICPVLLRYEELAPTRVQLQPPAGSKRPVRFVQCRTY